MTDIVERLRKADPSDLPGSVEELRKEAADEIERLRAIRETLGNYMLTARPDLVDDNRYRTECGGSGLKTYGTSGTWRSGSGGMTITQDVCDHCWGSGDADKPWPSHRAFERMKERNPS